VQKEQNCGDPYPELNSLCGIAKPNVGTPGRSTHPARVWTSPQNSRELGAQPAATQTPPRCSLRIRHDRTHTGVSLGSSFTAVSKRASTCSTRCRAAREHGGPASQSSRQRRCNLNSTAWVCDTLLLCCRRGRQTTQKAFPRVPWSSRRESRSHSRELEAHAVDVGGVVGQAGASEAHGTAKPG
jgi:hypothetical protein